MNEDHVICIMAAVIFAGLPEEGRSTTEAVEEAYEILFHVLDLKEKMEGGSE